MTSNHSRPDVPGRLLAFVVFLLGIGLLCAVFGIAWSLFQSPVAGLNLPVRPGTATPPAANIGVALTAFVRQLLLLALMCVAGSVIAGKGIHLYFGTAQSHSAPTDAPPVSKNGRAAAAPQTTDAEARRQPAD